MWKAPAFPFLLGDKWNCLQTAGLHACWIPFCNNIADTPAFWSLVGLKCNFFSYIFYFTGWPGGFITNLLWRKKEQRQWTVNVRPLGRNTFPTSTVPSEKRKASLQRSLQQLSLKKYASLRTLLTAARATRAACCHVGHMVCLISTYMLGYIRFEIIKIVQTPHINLVK